MSLKITTTIGGKPIEMTVDEARVLYDQLAALLDRRGLSPVYEPISPTPHQVPYWLLSPTCCAADPAR